MALQLNKLLINYNKMMGCRVIKMALEQELATYEGLKASLAIHEGKYALIHKDELLGMFDSQGDALNAGYQKLGLEPFLVKKIAAVESLGYFTRNVFPACIARA